MEAFAHGGDTTAVHACVSAYGSSVSASFKLPNCRYIPKYRSQPYTVEVNAVAPDGTEKSTSRMVSLRSCAP